MQNYNMYIKTQYESAFTLKRINADQTVTCIPVEPTNIDYQAYLIWIAEGNIPITKEHIPPVILDEPTLEERLAALELVVSMVFTEDDADV